MPRHHRTASHGAQPATGGWQRGPGTPPAPLALAGTSGTGAAPLHQRHDLPGSPRDRQQLCPREQTSPFHRENWADGEDQTHLWSPGGGRDGSSRLSPSSAPGQEFAGGSGDTRGGCRDAVARHLMPEEPVWLALPRSPRPPLASTQPFLTPLRDA